MPTNLYEKATHAVRYFLLRRLPACKEMVALMSQSMERPLSPRERVLLKLHLWVCVWCVWYLEQLRLLRASLRARDAAPAAAAPHTSSLSHEARERIKRSLNQGNQ